MYRMAEGQILFKDATPQEIQAVVEILQTSDFIYDIRQLDTDEISFRMDGYGQINYEPLEVAISAVKVKGFAIKTAEYEWDKNAGFNYEEE